MRASLHIRYADRFFSIFDFLLDCEGIGEFFRLSPRTFLH